MLRRFLAYGLTVQSDFDIPEFDALADDAALDSDAIRVTLADAPIEGYRVRDYTDALPPPKITVHGSSAVLRISDGQAIEMWETAPFDRDLNRAVLVGIGFSVLLYQRGLWPLHVSAVGTDQGVWLIGGPSGAGKSTLALWLHLRHQFDHLGDDAGVVKPGSSGFQFDYGSRAIRLLPEAADALIADAEQGRAVPAPAVDGKIKFRLRGRRRRAIPVLGLILLSERAEHEAASVCQRSGVLALTAVREVIYRPFGGLDLRSAADTLSFCGQFTATVPVYEFRRRKDFDCIDAESAPLLTLLRGRRGAALGGVGA